MPDLNEIASLINAGRKDQARQQLMEVLSTDPGNDQAWVYMAAVAKNKAEFEQSVRRALELNPVNNQALQLAEKYQLAVAPTGFQSAPAATTGRRVRRSGSRLRTCLVFIVLIAIVGGAAWYFLLRDTDADDIVSDNTTPEVTIEVADAGTSDATEEAVLESTQEAPTESSATDESALAATDEAAPTPVPGQEATADSTQAVTEVEGAEDISAFVIEADMRAGTGTLADDLVTQETFFSEDTINVVVALSDHDQALSVEAMLVHASGDAPLTVNRDVPAGAERTVVLPVDPGATGWTLGDWTAVIMINGQEVETLQFTVKEQPAPIATPRPSPTPTITPTPLPDPEIQLLYGENSMTLLNVSDENQNVNLIRFVQQTERGEFIFEAAQWQQMSTTGPGSTFALEPNDCFQIGINRSTASLPPEACTSLQWWIPVAQNAWVWIQSTGGSPTFDVFYEETLLATCEIAAQECSFAMPD